MAFTECNARGGLEALTLDQIEKQNNEAAAAGGGAAGVGDGGGGVTPPKPTIKPTNKPSLSAEEAMHRYSFCGLFWDDVSPDKADSN